MSDIFNHRRLAAMDHLRLDSRLTPAARLVGLDIFARVNRTSFDAWPTESTIASALGIDIKTVKRAIFTLERYRYFEIVRRQGHPNHYRPIFDVAATRVQNVPSIETRAENVPSCPSEVGDKKTAGGDIKVLPDEGKSGPQSPLSNPVRTPSTVPAQQPAAAFNASTQQADFGYGEDLREYRGDEQVEADLIRRLGPDGLDVLERLHAIDGGRPRLRLISAARTGKLREADLAAARLVAMRGEPRKGPLNANRFPGGASGPHGQSAPRIPTSQDSPLNAGQGKPAGQPELPSPAITNLLN